MSDSATPKKKEIWDRLATMAPIIGGVLVAIIGGIFTGVYTHLDIVRRKFELEVNRANQAHQNRILEMEAVERFFPHLTGNDEDTKKAAIITIGKLASPEIATELARLFDSQGAREGAEVVNRLVSSTTPSTAPTLSSKAITVSDKFPERWVYVGEYDKGWKEKHYLEFVGGEQPTPDELIDKQLPVRHKTGALNVRTRPLGDIIGSLQPGIVVTIHEVRDFANLGYIWARVSYK